MAQAPASDEMAKQLRAAWFQYLDTIEPIRPGLHRYCRRMTRDIWETEDLLQETLLRASGELS
jgi:DNA-directed RNA polymerase specialized sigma24 family protein